MGDTKADIIAAARIVLIREGSAGFSVRKVAKETGISLGNLQYHFASRTDLLGGLLAADVAEYQRVYADLRGEVDRTSDDRERRGLLRRFITLALGDARIQEELTIFRALLSFPEAEIAALLESYYRELSDLLIEGLAELSALPPDSAAVKRAATLLFPFLDGYATTAPFLPLDTEHTTELLTESVWRHLRPPDGRTAMQYTIREGLGTGPERPISDDMDDLIETWHEDAQFDRSIEERDSVDPDAWR